MTPGKESFANKLSIGGQPYSWGNLWVTTHGAACAAANKPCILEECKSTLQL